MTEDFHLCLEPGIDPGVASELQQRGHRLGAGAYFGGAQLIYRLGDSYCAASDPRKEGQAVGW